jgi:glycosyltransferase involved in cell wall biosynthesis
MRILIIHQNMPGQYKHIAPALAKDPENEVVFITAPGRPDIPHVQKIEFKVEGEVRKDTHKYLIPFQRAIYAGQEVWRVCKKLKDAGFTPDVICSHPGWGDALFVKDIFPDSPMLSFLEFYYRTFGADMHFDPKDKPTPDDGPRVRIKNSNNILSLEACDWGISPTKWQASQNPKEFLPKISVIHDGVDTDFIQPKKISNLKLPDGKVIPDDAEIVTYLARNFEPYRGSSTAIRAAKKVVDERPNAHAIIWGGDEVSYGKENQGKKSYREELIDELGIHDHERIHFFGRQPYAKMIEMLQRADVHIYLTVPFVLSWSMIEAMAAGCAIVGSSTQPVQEVIKNGYNGLLADFFSPDDIAEKVCQLLDDPIKRQEIKINARKTVEELYALKNLLPLHVGLIKDIANKQLPPATAQIIAEQHSNKIQLAA